MRVLVSDKFPNEGLQLLEQAEGIELDYQPGLTAEQLLVAVATADALIVRSGTPVTEAVLMAAPQLKVVGRAGVGTGNLDLEAATRRGVVVMHTPFGSTTTTAEHTIAMVFALARQIPLANQSTKSGEWASERFLGIEISGKTIGVLGGGKIGRLVIERALALKMRPIVYDPYLTEDTVRRLGAELVDFEDFLTRSDFVTLHTPLNAETANILNSDTLSRVKPGCYIINCATGGLIDEIALAAAIKSGRVAGAAIDVFAKEPPEKGNPLLKLDQVICTPHLRTATRDAQVNVTVQVSRQVIDFLNKGVIVNAVNVPSISADLLATLRPHIELAERLGSFQAQLYGKGLEEVRLEYSGTVTQYPTEALTMAALKGILTPMVGPEANYINAKHLAKERHISIVETRSHTTRGFSSMIRVTVVGADGEHALCGAMFGQNDYRIVQVNGCFVEASPHGYILVLFNEDHPGIIGFIGQLLGEAGINIASMNLTRQSLDGQAVSLINIDSCIPDETLEKLRAHRHIVAANQIVL